MKKSFLMLAGLILSGASLAHAHPYLAGISDLGTFGTPYHYLEINIALDQGYTCSTIGLNVEYPVVTGWLPYVPLSMQYKGMSGYSPNACQINVYAKPGNQTVFYAEMWGSNSFGANSLFIVPVELKF